MKTATIDKLWLVLLFCVGIGFLVFVLQVGFLGDDLRFLYDVEHTHGLREVVRYAVQPLGAVFVWRPFTNLFWYAERMAFGTNPAWYHIVHFLLYTAITLSLYRIIKRFGGAHLAMVAAGLYFITPYHYEGFVWLSSVTDLLALTGSLAAVLLFIRFRDTGKHRMLALSCVAFILAALSKEFALMTPFIILLIDLVFLRNSRGRGWKPFAITYAPMLVIVAAYLVARVAVLGNLSGSNPNTVGSFIDSFRPSYLKMAVNSMTFRFNVAALARVAPGFASFWSRWHGYLSVATTAVLFSLGVPRFSDRQFWKLVALAFGVIVLVALPVLPLLGNINENLQHTRFLLAPSAGVALLMAVLVTDEGNIARGMRFAKRTALAFIIVIYAIALAMNASPWVRATELEAKAVNDVARFPEITNAATPTTLYVHALPGSIDGAFAFHDLYSFREAFAIRYRNGNVAVVPVGRYEVDQQYSLCQTPASSVHLLHWKTDHFELEDGMLASWITTTGTVPALGFDSTATFVKNGWQAQDLMVRQVDRGIELSDFGDDPTLTVDMSMTTLPSMLRSLEIVMGTARSVDLTFAWKTVGSPNFTEFQSIPFTAKGTTTLSLCAWTNWFVGGELSELQLRFPKHLSGTVEIGHLLFR